MFANKVIMVTGAAGNVGSALSKLLASRSARVVLVDTVRDRLAATADSLEGSGHHTFSEYDLTDPAAAEALVAKVQSECGHLDGVGTTVGGFAMAKLHEAPLADYDRMFDLNVRTLFHALRAVLPGMLSRNRGFIAAFSSEPAWTGVAGHGKP